MTAKEFDGDAFYRALEKSVKTKGANWRVVSQDTGVSQTTLTRMGQGRRPDAASMAALSAWADINPAHFVGGMYASREGRAENDAPDTMSLIGQALREDTSLSDDARRHLESIMSAAYEALKLAGAKQA